MLWQLEELGRLYARALKDKNPTDYNRYLAQANTTYYYSSKEIKVESVKVEKDKEADKPHNKPPEKPSEMARDESSRKRKAPGKAPASSGAAGRYARLPS